MTSTTPATRPAGPGPGHPGSWPGAVTSSPAPDAAARITRVLREHPSWSVFWDKAHGLWRAAEDDPDSGLYAESPDAGAIISYIQDHA